MLTVLRRNCQLEDTAADYTDAVLLVELNDALTTSFERSVIDAKANYWITYQDYTLTAGQALYRLPQRNIGLSKVELSGASPNSQGWCRLPETSEDHIDAFQGPLTSQGTPERYVLRSDRIWLFPTPSSSLTLRVWYYTGPSRLIPFNALTTGQIASIDTTNRVLTLTAAAIAYDTPGSTTPTTITTGTRLIDVVGQNVWHDMQLVNVSATFTASGLTVTLPVGTDMSYLQVGDWVRAADQSDYPMIPEDFHRTIVDIASVKILIQRDFQGKASGYAQSANADMQRFALMIADRVQEEPYTHRADLPSLRAGIWGGGWGF
jgi:hypothetical protein